MGVRPNVVVGVFGAAVFLLTGTLIVTNWRDLTGLDDWTTTVHPLSKSFRANTGPVGSGQTRTLTFQVPLPNVTTVDLRVTWSDTGLAQHEVTVTLKDPDGDTVASGTSEGGVAGLSLSSELRKVPAPTRFTSTRDAADDEFDERYPVHDESNGTWTVTIRTNLPSQGASSIRDVSVTLSYQYYFVTYAKADAGIK